ncbi:metal ABC transporter ATP-binding protein [Zavarzinella formosa]|uniref:metal ABC transporter ATP-binding protein n=1 Tax=Zavarzinella formosa TaxID=360055 RepID=UPI0002F7333B|nr:metal ABC transporter ATP-binding protein [Zavarzinella formosa]
MNPVLASIQNLSISLGGRQILNGVNADILRNKITALIGLNGSGKSTLLKALIREIPYRGQIKFFCGHDHTLPQPKHVGYVPQKLAIDGRLPLTVREFFALSLQRRPIFLGIAERVTQTADRLLSIVGARHLLNRPIAKLSGGELQRVLLSLALQPNPELLLLDEPAAGIDFADEKPFYDLLADINRRQGVSILIVSHDISIVSEHSHHVLCLQNGKVVCQGPPGEVLTPELMGTTFGQGKRLYGHDHADGEHCEHDDGCGHSHGM